MHLYMLDADGAPVPTDDVIAWATWFETSAAERRVGLDVIPAAVDGVPDVTVSTVFLGLDHAHGRGAPVLWETLIFGGPLDGHGDRYTSRQAAIAGHHTWAAWARVGQRQP